MTATAKLWRYFKKGNVEAIKPPLDCQKMQNCQVSSATLVYKYHEIEVQRSTSEE